MSTRDHWQDDLTGPRWARRMWVSRAGRLGFALFMLMACTWILVKGVTDPEDFFDGGRAVGAFVFAPPLVLIFATVAAETLRDIARGENRRPLLTRRDLHRPMTIAFVVYIPVAVVALVLWR